VVRQWGLAARYVSGYLRTDKSLGDQSSPDATHAWMEVFLPDLGWIGFDPTNNCIADNRHIRVAIGRDYADVPPTRGVFRGASESELAVAVSVSETDAPKRNEDFLRVVRPKPRRGVKQTAKRAPLDAPLQTTQQ
ncbi:MAG: transglutaminase family protein, partial [Pseudomonadota bacterium]